MTVLFVIATIVIFLTIDWFIQRTKQRRPLAISQQKPAFDFAIRLPDGIFFAPSHTWLSLFPTGKVHLGVDDFISRLLDNPEISFLKTTGEQISKGDPLILLKTDGHKLSIRSPIDGEVLAINERLPENPKLLQEALFSDGWAYLIKPKHHSDLKNLLLGTETRTWIRHEFQRLKDLLAGLVRNGSVQPAFLQEGGPPIPGALKMMDDIVWQHIDNEFLKVQ